DRPRGLRTNACVRGDGPQRQHVRDPVPVRGHPDVALRGRVLPGRGDAVGGQVAGVRLAALAWRRAQPGGDARWQPGCLPAPARRLPGGVGRGRLPAGLLAVREEAHRLMVTALALPRLLANNRGALSRIAAVTRRDLTAVRHSGYWLV